MASVGDVTEIDLIVNHHSRANFEGTTFLISTYTDNEILAHVPTGNHGKGIYTWHLNNQGLLSEKPLAVSNITPNPAFILKHPTLDLVYISTECIHTENCGEVITCALNLDGSLKEVSRISAGGRSTCYLNIHHSNKFLTAVNYWDAIVSLFHLDTNGLISSSYVDKHQHPEASYVFSNNPDRVEHWTYRQRWPHTHCFVTDPLNKNIHFVCDLGKDIMWVYRILEDEQTSKLILCGGAQLEINQGPRHVVFHPSLHICFVVNELKSTVSVFEYDSKKVNDVDQNNNQLNQNVIDDENNVPIYDVPIYDSNDSINSFLKHVQTIRTLPNNFESKDHHRSHAAEIRIHPNGNFLLIANRGHDSIACFKINTTISSNQDQFLSLVHIIPSGGECPRNFNFDLTGNFVVVGNQNSNNLTSFSFNQEDGSMDMIDQKYQPSPNFVYPLKQNN